MSRTIRPWTYPEVAELKRLAARDIKTAAIARRLNRPPGSVGSMMCRLNLRRYYRHGENDELVRRLAAEGWWDKEIGRRIGRSRGAVQSIRLRLGIVAGRFAAEPRNSHPERDTEAA